MSAVPSPIARIAFGVILAVLLAATVWLFSGVSPERAGAQGDVCANTPIRSQQNVGYLPDCRAYEMVSPQHKNGSDAAIVGIFGQPWLPGVKASFDGDAITYMALNAFGDAQSSPLFAQILSERHGNGWSTRTINPPHRPHPGQIDPIPSEFHAFNEDLSAGIVATFENPTLAPGATHDAQNFYRVNLATDSYKLLLAGDELRTSPGANIVRSTFRPAYSRDLRHAAFEVRTQPHRAAPSEVYEGFIDENGDSHERIASVDYVTGQPIEGMLGSSPRALNDNPTAMSDDGSRVLFGSPRCCTGQDGTAEVLKPDRAPSDLYLRDTETGGPDATTWVSAPAPGAPADPTSPRLDAFWGASIDASRVFFTSGERLTTDSTGDPSVESFGDLYAYDYETDHLRDISIDAGHPNGARVRGVVGISDDGDEAYFVAGGTLGTGEGTDGQPNLFHWRDGPDNGEVAYVATLAPETGSVLTSDLGNYIAQAFARTARLTPSAQLLFESLAQLTEDDSNSDRDVYLYAPEGDSLVCVSCSSTATGSGSSHLRHYTTMFAAGGGTYPNAFSPQHHVTSYRNISASGGIVFFESEQSLLPRDGNGRQDVYRYDVQSDELALISSGRSPHDSYFADASRDGRSVFIATRERLTGWDIDDLYDVYDVRVGGGVPEPAVDPGCEGDACQAPSQPAPAGRSPASTSFHGAGNPDNRKGCERLGRKAEVRDRIADKRKRKAKKFKRVERKLQHKMGHASGRAAKRLERKARRVGSRNRRAGRKARKAMKRARQAKRMSKQCRRGGGS